ncbi:MAG TPA: ABC transporter substrate-binding protein [Candidatus Binatia bacterium]|jgi:putative ABC transport system substrate-binding protein
MKVGSRQQALGNSKAKVFGFALCVLLFPLCLSAKAQQPTKVYHVGYISPRNVIGRNEDAFRKRMHELRYMEGQNFVIDWRFASGKTSLFPELAAELVRLKVDAIVGQGVGATGAAKKATTTIPIIMSNADDDPVRLGLVASLARPGGNVTGFISISSDIAGKRLELLKETVPNATRFAILSRPRSQGTAAASHVKETEVAAQALGIRLQALEARGREDLEDAFRTARKVAEALIVVAVAGMINDRDRILALAAKTRLPVMYTNPEPVLAGGLMSYAADLPALARGAADYVDRIFKGAKPADLPVQQPTKFELIVNLKTAKQIGLSIPPNVLVRADKVIK